MKFQQSELSHSTEFVKKSRSSKRFSVDLYPSGRLTGLYLLVRPLESKLGNRNILLSPPLFALSIKSLKKGEIPSKMELHTVRRAVSSLSTSEPVPLLTLSHLQQCIRETSSLNACLNIHHGTPRVSPHLSQSFHSQSIPSFYTVYRSLKSKNMSFIVLKTTKTLLKTFIVPKSSSDYFVFSKKGSSKAFFGVFNT